MQKIFERYKSIDSNWYNFSIISTDDGKWHSYDITNNNKNVPSVETCTVSEEGKIFKLPKIK